MNKKLLLTTFRNTSGAAIYIFLVSQIMQNGSKLFGETDTMFTPFIILMLFSLSAGVVGGLVFGVSIISFIEGKREDGIKAAIYSISWLAIYTVLCMSILIIAK